jgi:5S rRNA maturation endonuclease (ribonuclease M5)
VIGDVLNALQSHGKKFKRSGDGYQAQCPAHDDTNPSLSIKEGLLGGVLLNCFASCPEDAILRALDLPRSAVLPAREGSDEWTPRGPALDIYRYTDEHGELLFEVCRCSGKNFPQRRPDKTAKSGWNWRLGDIRRPLYHLPRLLKGIEEGSLIWVVEGEKDVHTLEGLGEVATCNPGGVDGWRDEHTKTLAGAVVAIITDRDDVGRKHARKVEAELVASGASVTRFEAAEGKDVTDHVQAGKTLEDLLQVSEDEQLADLAPDLAEFLEGEDVFNWLVPGLIERGERVMLTGYEGLGKSMTLRQISICVAAGLHPFKFTPIEPRRVLFIDCENTPNLVRRKMRPIRDQAERSGHPIKPGMMHVLMRPKGLDLTTEDDRAWLYERAVAHKPDLLVLGPLYRLHTKDPNDELVARTVSTAIDDARDVAQCAVILEAHSGHGSGATARSLRPTGSSLWLRSTDFGFGIRPLPNRPETEVEFHTWRGPRDERAFPNELHRGQVWPWEGVYRHKQEVGMF